MTVCVFLACSNDGFVAGLDDDLSFLPDSEPAPGQSSGFEQLIDSCACLLIGRRSYDVVRSLGQWPYRLPVFVATHRPLDQDYPDNVSTISGSIDTMISALSESGDIYLDGPSLIKQALGQGLVDEATITIVDYRLGQGIALPDFNSGPRRAEEVGRRDLRLADETVLEQVDYRFN